MSILKGDIMVSAFCWRSTFCFYHTLNAYCCNSILITYSCTHIEFVHIAH